MAESLPRVHHVVFAVAPEHFDSAEQFLSELGFEFQTFELADVGLRVKLDWDRGIEVVTPTTSAGHTEGSVADFLQRSGEGVFSVVIRAAQAQAAEYVAHRYGATTQYRQQRQGPGFELEEIQVAAAFGMPLTFLTTDLS